MTELESDKWCGFCIAGAAGGDEEADELAHAIRGAQKVDDEFEERKEHVEGSHFSVDLF